MGNESQKEKLQLATGGTLGCPLGARAREYVFTATTLISSDATPVEHSRDDRIKDVSEFLRRRQVTHSQQLVLCIRSDALVFRRCTRSYAIQRKGV